MQPTNTLNQLEGLHNRNYGIIFQKIIEMYPVLFSLQNNTTVCTKSRVVILGYNEAQ